MTVSSQTGNLAFIAKCSMFQRGVRGRNQGRTQHCRMLWYQEIWKVVFPAVRRKQVIPFDAKLALPFSRRNVFCSPFQGKINFIDDQGLDLFNSFPSPSPSEDPLPQKRKHTSPWNLVMRPELLQKQQPPLFLLRQCPSCCIIVILFSLFPLILLIKMKLQIW